VRLFQLTCFLRCFHKPGRVNGVAVVMGRDEDEVKKLKCPCLMGMFDGSRDRCHCLIPE
jgi:ferredoxin-thioredoxin reductase catalytic subunit